MVRFIFALTAFYGSLLLRLHLENSIQIKQSYRFEQSEKHTFNIVEKFYFYSESAIPLQEYAFRFSFPN